MRAATTPIAGLAFGLALTGCGIADSHAPMAPQFMREAETPPKPLGPQPDAARLVRENIKLFFVSPETVRRLQVSQPHPAADGRGWIVCVRASAQAITGQRLAAETFRATIVDGRIVERRRVGRDDACASESYAPA